MTPHGRYYALAGPGALSAFRAARLLRRLQAVEPNVAAVSGRFVHFVHATRALDDSEEARLKALLDYGEPGGPKPGRHRLPRRAAARHDLAVGQQGHRHRPQHRPGGRASDRARHDLHAGTEAWSVPWQGTRCGARGSHPGRAARPDDGKRDRAVDRSGAALHGTGRQAGAERPGAGRGPGCPRARQWRPGTGAVRRRGRLPRRCLHAAPPRSDRRRTDDVRAGELRTLPPQDLQRGAGPSTASGRTRRSSA